MLEQKEWEHTPSLSIFFSWDPILHWMHWKRQVWDPAWVTILELCQKSLSCKHTNSPWHWEPSWGLSKPCQWQTPSLPAVRLPAASMWAESSCPGVCASERAEGLHPRRDGLGQVRKSAMEENLLHRSTLCSPIGKDGSGAHILVMQGCSEVPAWGLAVLRPTQV